MGSSCSKGEQKKCPKRVKSSEPAIQVYSQTCLEDDFSIKLDCFSITTKLLSSKNCSVTKGCKSVLVTSIKLEVNDPKMATVYSVLHMPVIRFSDVEVVNVQLPELLPLNLWTGTQMIFSFVSHDTPEDSDVILMGKVGTKSISIQQRIEKGPKLSTEELSQINKSLEKEVMRFKKKRPRGMSEQEEGREKKEEKEEEGNGNGEENDRRESQVTCRAPSVEIPYSGLTYIEDTTDSEKTSNKEQVQEKKPKPRRKDTPSHNIPFSPKIDSKISSLNQFKLRLGEHLLEEEQERDNREEASDLGHVDNDLAKDHSTGVDSEALDLSQGKLHKHRRKESLQVVCSLDTHVPISVSRSFNNIRELIDEPKEVAILSPISLRAEPRFKRKKVSIGSKLSRFTFQGQKIQRRSVSTSPNLGQDFGHDADDEGETVNEVIRKRKDRRTNKESAKEEETVKEFNKQPNSTRQCEYSDISDKENPQNDTEDSRFIGASKSTEGKSGRGNVSSATVRKETDKAQSRLFLDTESPENKSKSDIGSTAGPLNKCGLKGEINEAQRIEEYDKGDQTGVIYRQESDPHTHSGSSITDETSSGGDKGLKENVVEYSGDLVQQSVIEKQISSQPQETGTTFQEDISHSQTRTTRSMTISETVKPSNLRSTRRKAPSLDEHSLVPTGHAVEETRSSTPLHAFVEKKE